MSTFNSQQVSWQIVVKPDLAAAAYAAARNIAVRLRDRVRVQEASQLALQQTLYPYLLNKAFSLSGGNTGLALFFSALDALFPEEGWDAVGHQHLQIAVQAFKDLPGAQQRLSLASGLSGLLFATWSLSHGGTRYQKLLATLEQQALPRISALATKVLVKRVHGCAETLYDQISGLAGMGTYLLSRSHVPEVAQTLQTVLQTILYLTQEKDGVPHYYVPAKMALDPAWSAVYPDGYINCGLAHGIPALLALLSLARMRGIDMPELDVAIKHVADRLVDFHREDEWGITWPRAWPIGRVTSPELLQGTRTAWCYGTPGVAYALWLAGKALDCETYSELARVGMQSVFRRPLAARRISSPSFCHGIAGLLQITLHFANATGDALFSQAANTLCEQLLSLYQPASLLGYRHLDIEGSQVLVDHPWLLDGVAGIALVLLAASTSNEPSWDRCFLPS
ncbi:hypothetical protein EPA93_02565 [Ktedonosporobacter rubrisoli]|uniref:Lanthionine synthetase n=1 Tax=Ktedonosporobacter rubrisoli TaxID=2509675 RepID=A0A4P6JJ38_KTERU|nr:lanthionine synthetase C family protein [Ktedonosporobacter rubrisoli]QBD74930.1 hypothetical protein EPA93_02565 [Ktedonosporobacter rubrisoli]